MNEKLKSYLVVSSDSVDWPTLSSDSSSWKEAIALSDFSYPWDSDEVPSTVFKACHDHDWLYCRFEVTDNNIQVFVDKNEKEEVILGDRVEIFFRRDERLDLYYCLEVDLHGRVYDYRASFYRKFEPWWTWPSGHLKVEAGKTNDGYVVNLAVSMESLKSFGLLKNNQVQTGLFRGKCCAIDKEKENMKWISWMKPESENPDFHIPSAFGIFKLI